VAEDEGESGRGEGGGDVVCIEKKSRCTTKPICVETDHGRRKDKTWASHSTSQRQSNRRGQSLILETQETIAPLRQYKKEGRCVVKFPLEQRKKAG